MKKVNRNGCPSPCFITSAGVCFNNNFLAPYPAMFPSKGPLLRRLAKTPNLQLLVWRRTTSITSAFLPVTRSAPVNPLRPRMLSRLLIHLVCSINWYHLSFMQYTTRIIQVALLIWKSLWSKTIFTRIELESPASSQIKDTFDVSNDS